MGNRESDGLAGEILAPADVAGYPTFVAEGGEWKRSPRPSFSDSRFPIPNSRSTTD